MKYRFMGIAALFLAAAMTLTACGGSAPETDDSTAEQTDIQSVPVDSTDNQTDSQSESVLPDTTPADMDTTESSATSVDEDMTESSTAITDAFSNRDMSGTWDTTDAVEITLNGSSISSDSGAVTVSGSTATITASGVYLLSGTLENGTIIVDAGETDKVQLVLNGVSVNSDTFAAIYVRQADKIFITLADGTVNTLSNGGTFTAIDENSVDGVIFSKDDLTLNGSGTLLITSSGKHGIVCKDSLVITGGTYEITASSHALSGKDSVAVADGTFTLTAGKDGIHADNDEDDTLGTVYIAGGTFEIQSGDDAVHAISLLQIDGGEFTISASEGMEATYVRVNDGTINIYASDDGINATQKSSAYTPTVEINGGEITVEVGPGDTDGIDSNGNLIITGGTVSVTGASAFDFDGSVTFTGGTVIVNGQQVDTIPNQQMGGRGGMGFGGMGRNFGGEGAPNGMNPGNLNPDGSQRGIWGGGRRNGTVPGNGTIPGDGQMPEMPGNGQMPEMPDESAAVTASAQTIMQDI